MSHARRALRRLFSSFLRTRDEDNLSREISAHLQLLEDEFVAKGMPRGEARYAAKRAFGGVEQAKEQQRDARTFRSLASWPMDLKLGARMLVRTPGLTIIAVAALAVAIGAGAAYLEFVNDLIRPTLSGPGAERIVGLRVWDAARSQPESLAPADVAAWRTATATLESAGAFRQIERELMTGDGRTGHVRGVEVSAAAFRLFPAAPLLGRALRDDDEEPGAPPVVVIGHDLWRARFDAAPDIVGRIVIIGEEEHTVAGVMPAGFGFPTNQNLWVPLKLHQRTAGRPIRQLFGRVKDGASIEAARAELTAILAEGEERAPAGSAMRVDVREFPASLMSAETSGTAIAAALYSGNLLFLALLAICGANVATLVFARTATRETEIALRTALGASRARITAQLFAEALVLSIISAVAGLLAAGFIGRWMGRRFTEGMGAPLAFWWNDSLSVETVLYALALAVGAAVLVGVIPALKATGARPHERLRQAGGGSSTMRFGKFWTGIIVAQLAVTVVVLAALSSVAWGIYQARNDNDVSFVRGEFLTASLVVAGTDVPARARFTQLHESLAAAPGVVGVTYATELPGTTFGRSMLEFAAPGVADDAIPHEDGLWARSAGVGPGYFETVGIPFVSGRAFTRGEVDEGRPVAIVDESFVRLILGQRNAVGLLVREPAATAEAAPGPWREIVGVVRDVTVSARKKSFDAMLYYPAPAGPGPVRLLMRTRADAASLSPVLQAAVRSLPGARIADVKTLARAADEEALGVHVLLRALSVVAGVALLLSTAGIYALVSFTLARRTREIGIRLALGATQHRILTTTFSRVFLQAVAGVVVGSLPGAAILMSGVEDSGGLSGSGLGVTLAVGLFVIVVATLACAAPLRRALRIQPTDALRLS